MKELVRLRTRPSRNGKTFTYFLDYVDENSKRCRLSLGHSDGRKAERQRVQKERELRMGIIVPKSMKLSDFLDDSLSRTGKQIRKSKQDEYRSAMSDSIVSVGNIDYQTVSMRHGELYRQTLLDSGNSAATVIKKLKTVKRIFELAVERGRLEENPLRKVKTPRAPKKEDRDI